MMKKPITFLILLTATAVMLYSGSLLIATGRDYREADSAYEYLSYDMRTASSPPASADMDEPAVAYYIPDLGVDFDALKKINTDVVAWLYCPGTVIDYPVMEAEDYDYYLHHLPDGTQNKSGSLFIDFNCSPDFSSPLTIIYGHNMKTKKMFGSISGYKKQAYYDEHPIMYLYTPQSGYRVELLYGCVIDAGLWTEKGFMFPENVGALIAYASRNTTFNSAASYEEGDKLLAMATCSYEFDDARYVVIGILRGLSTDKSPTN